MSQKHLLQVINPNVLREIKIPNYPVRYSLLTTKGKISKIRPKYYIEGDLKIPKKFSNRLDYEFFPFSVIRKGKKVEEMRLINTHTGECVLKNENKAGTERSYTINGSDLHTCRMTDYQRSSILNTIKTHCKKYLENIQPIEVAEFTPYPLKAHFLFYTNTNQDLGNHLTFYEKAIIDLLVTNKIIPNDTRYFINGLYFDILPSKTEKNNLKITLFTL